MIIISNTSIFNHLQMIFIVQHLDLIIDLFLENQYIQHQILLLNQDFCFEG